MKKCKKEGSVLLWIGLYQNLYLRFATHPDWETHIPLVVYVYLLFIVVNQFPDFSINK